MDNINNVSEPAGNDSHIPRFSPNCEQKQMQSDTYVKVNGDHNMPQHIFPSDDESIATTPSSSSSPRNLIIDHQDENSKDGADDKKAGGHSKRPSIETEPFPELFNVKPMAFKERTQGMKRKLSLREMTNPYLPKKRRHSAKSLDRLVPDKHFSGQAVTNYQSLKDSEHRNSEQNPAIAPIPKGTGPFREYANYLRLKPTTIPIKCFKCSSSTFENLHQLRDHQKICLFKDKPRTSTFATDSKNNASTCRLIEDRLSELRSSNSVEITNSTLSPSAAKQKQAAPGSNTTARAKKRVFLCSACGTYYENWNLFLHMREVHKRHICLYCIGMFPSAERLTFHLEMKHDLEQNHYDCQEKLLRSSRDSCYLMCCVCEHLFTEHEDFSDHKCADHLQPCSLCGQKGRHAPNCKAGTQPSKTKHKDHHAKRKNKVADKNSNLPTSETLEKRTDPILNGNDPTHQETSILRKIITDGDRKPTPNEDYVPSILKVNGCAEAKTSENFENMEPFNRPSQESTSHDNGDNNINSLQKLEETPQNCVIPSIDVQPNDPEPPPPVESDVGREEQDKPNESLESSLSQSNATPELTSRSPSSPDRELNDSVNEMNDSIKSSDVSQTQEAPVESRPLLVPKFKIKIPKEFQTPIESEQSSTESDDNEANEEHEVEEQSEGSDMDIEEDMPGGTVEPSNEINESIEEDEKSFEHKIDSEEEKKEFSFNMESIKENSSSPIPSPKEEVKDESVEHKSSTPEPMNDIKPPDENDSNEIAVADEDIPLLELLLDQPLDKIDMVAFMRICLRASYRICLYCNHARRIAVNAHSFALHLISQHRFSAIVDSITAEELKPSTIVQKLMSFLPDLENLFFNLETYCSNDKENLKPYEKIFECFQCRFETRIHKELYLHNRKMHLKTAILCFMCRSNFFSYSEILCHMCPGVPNKCVIFDIKFRCCLCDIDNVPSAFRLMVHLRKKHYACDVCLEDCFDQSRLSSHVWKHKLHHLCYRCGIAYRNKPDITKHLFWKHGTESVLCKRCLQKRWPHVYHFCIPPTSFVCEVCNVTFSKAMALKVHKRLHSGDAPYPCPEDDCDQKFISRKLLLKHSKRHIEPAIVAPEVKEEEQKEEVVEKANEECPSEGEKEQQECQEDTPEKNQKEESKEEDDRNQSKRKRKRSRRNKENLDDLMDLPALNLSESDSSDDSETEKAKSEKRSTPIPQVMLSPPSDPDADEDVSNSTGTQIMDIWENFKTFQASQAKTQDNDSDENDDAPPPPILHVTQSDHDYCMMFKPISKILKASSKDDLTELPAEEPKSEHSSPKKKQKSPRKAQRSGSDSSSSGSSSGSDSSCSCGSNCSCSSSSGSSSDSSSSSDSDSSSSEGRRRAAARRAAKLEKKNHSKSEEQISEEMQVQSPKANTSDIVDVVTTDTKPQEIIDPDSVILESDLETEESDTDEDFYDEHPQKLANQLLAEKRKQLLMQTSLSPSHNFDIVENSRPSTPSIPEEMVKEKKVKIKKKKREKRASKSGIGIVPAFKLDIPVSSLQAPPIVDAPAALPEPLPQPEIVPYIPETVAPAREEIPSMPVPAQQPLSSSLSMAMPAPLTPKNRLSTGSSSDADAPLKRSKRRRRPNKFYGYSSDDEMAASGFPLFRAGAFKPTPPPNLTWRKEDLPTPPSKSSAHKSHRSPAIQGKKSTPANTPPLTPHQGPPPIPPIIIRPSALLSKKPMSVDSAVHKPPVVQPIRVPPVPVHHIRPPQYVSPNRGFDESETSSDDDNRLTILTPAAKKNSQRSSAHSKLQPAPQQYHLPAPPASIYPEVPQQPQLPQVVSQSGSSGSTSSTSIDSKRIPPALLPNPDAARIEYFRRNNIRYPIQPPAGARPPREGESVYCYCRCPYDEVSEMIACDGDDCVIEWFHFECVGILVPPQGKWFCPECRPLYPNETANIGNT